MLSKAATQLGTSECGDIRWSPPSLNSSRTAVWPFTSAFTNSTLRPLWDDPPRWLLQRDDPGRKFLLVGERDRILPADYRRSFAARLQYRKDWIVLPEAEHMLPLKHLERTVPLVAE